MALKDYYRILNVPPQADEQQIKKAFRSLALLYHPDKTQGDKYKEALFREIQEAYQVLSDLRTREEYNYKRWYTRSLGKTFREEPISPSLLLKESGKLATYVATINYLHLDFDILSQNARRILSDENVEILVQLDDRSANSAIIANFLKITDHLPVKYLPPILAQLRRLVSDDAVLSSGIDKFETEKKSREYWEKRKGWIVLALVLALCAVMYWFGSQS